MTGIRRIANACLFSVFSLIFISSLQAQMPLRYATLELFTNTPCPICGSQNPGFFDRLSNYEGEYHLVSFYPGKPYSSCIFYQANISENTARLNFYTQVFGTPTVAINGTQFKSSGSMSTTVLDEITGGESWLSVEVAETGGSSRTATITLRDHVGGSLNLGKLFAVIVEKEIMYNAPNGETLHHNVFRKFLSTTNGDDVDMTPGVNTKTYQYTVDGSWQSDQVYVIAWLMNPNTMEIYNSGTKFDPPVTTSTVDVDTKSLQIYPNPANAEINLQLPEGSGDATYRITDLAGRVVKSGPVADVDVLNLNTGDLLSGNYQLELVTTGSVYTARFQVVRE